LELEPLAVLVSGSYAAGRAEPSSDLDLMLLVDREPTGEHRTWFEDRPGRPLHVSCGCKLLDRWIENGREPAEWSLGFPTEEATTVLWATDAARRRLGDPPTVYRPAGMPELEDFVESASKAQRALVSRDGAGARWHAHDMAAYAPTLLVSLNPERRVTDRRDALAAALALPLAPPHYAADLATCLALDCVAGLTLTVAALRLPQELLAFLRARQPDLDPLPWISRYLADGSLERHLNAIEETL
ncbi:MAG: nucleotidyltransferase domain-containing protein, partial [Chloroflexota bacterium]|nr:nucleotidyltransferase domain-containing protein [Chloroflexota bacterium]